MKFRLIYRSLFLSLLALSSHQNIMGRETVTVSEIVALIETNNLSLKKLGVLNEAELLDMKTENVIGPTSVEYTPFFRSGVSGLASSELIVKQEFDFPTQYASRSKAISLRRDMLDAETASKRREIRVDAMQSCIDLVTALNKINIIGRRLEMTDSLIQLYEKKYELHAATALDLNLIRLSRQEVAKAYGEALMESSQANSTLTMLNGGEPLELDHLVYDCPISEISLPLSAKDFASSSPEVSAATAGIKFSEQDLRQAREGWLPTVGVGYRRNTEGCEASNGFVIGLDFPIFSAGKRTAAARARKAVAEIELEETGKEIEAKTDEAINQLLLMRLTLDSYNIDLVRETLALYHECLRLGQITLTDYIRETDLLYERMLTNAELEKSYRRLAATLMQ